MKIGIITQPLEDNYGGILQNWALQQVLKDIGHEPITLDYGLKYSWSRYLLSCGKTLIYRLRRQDRRFPHRPRHGRYGSKYSSEFIFECINKTKPVKALSTALLKEYKIDSIIVGSDQVWRPKYNNHIEDSYLEFAKDFSGKRISYAASFGVDEWEYTDIQTEHCRELVKSFNAVSVREESGITLCRDFLGIEAIHVLDPTMLINKDKYMELCKNVEKSRGQYIAVYCIDIDDRKRKIISNISEKNKLPLKLFSANSDARLTIKEWLAMFRDAEMVITDSFHGTVFSIIFHKPFHTIVNEGRGSGRFYSLFDSLGISYNLDKNINWDMVDEKLGVLQKNSFNFLIYAL